MKNPASQRDEIFLIRIDGDVKAVPVTYSRQGVATAWEGFSDTILERAGGYGYCKTSTALARAISKLILRKHAGIVPPEKLFIAEAIARAGGTGVDSVMRVAREAGIPVVDSYRYALTKFCE
jgi:hypothetical protein